MFATLRQRDFALLWTAGLISMIGNWVLTIGVPVYIYRLTGSTLATGALLVVSTVPGLVFGSVAGVFADRWDRRRTMIAINLLQALGLLPLLLAQSIDTIWIVYAMLFAEAMLALFFVPAERALLPLLVEERDLPAANTLNALNGNLARLLGPALGGALVAVSSLVGVTLVDAVSFALSAILIAVIADRRGAPRPEQAAMSLRATARHVRGEWRAGLDYVRRRPALATLIGLGGLVMLGEGFLGTLIVPYVVQVMKGTDSDFGYLMACQAVGGILGSFLIARLVKRLTPLRLFAFGALGMGLIDLVIFSYPLWIPGVELGMVLFVVVGVPAIGFGAGFMTLMQTFSEDAYRGRVFGLYGALSALLLLVGAVLAGILGEHVSIVLLLTVQGGGFVLAGILALTLLQRSAGEGRPGAVAAVHLEAG